uniref:BED-type domain-containing protein n=1 Tax=Amphimedon queenslandica TaxID=400682 RepID=A0A1X7TF38_AMPQE
MANSPVFDHYNLPEADNTDAPLTNFKALCKHCKVKVSGSYKATSNFITHLKRKHPEIHKSLSKCSPATQAKVTEYTTALRKWHHNDDGQISLTQSIVSFIAKDLLPVSLVESGAFREVIEKAQPAYTMPSRKHLCTKLILCANIHQKMKLKFQEAHGVCLTIDLWSSRDMRSFIDITVHFIENFCLCC